MSRAELVVGGARPSVRLERALPGPPEAAWEKITDRDQLRAWFPSDVDVDGGIWAMGAPITFRFPADVIEMTLLGEVLEIDKPRVLSYTWGDEVLHFELSVDGSGTRLVLTDELAPNCAARNAAGWDDCLDRLVGVVPPEGSWRARFTRYAQAFEPTLGPQDGPPEGYKGT